MKYNDIFSLTALVSILSFVGLWVPLHYYLLFYWLLIELLVQSPFGSLFIKYGSKIMVNYLNAILESSHDFPSDAIVAFR